METIDFQLSLPQWWWIAVLAFGAMILFCAIRWRRRVVGTMAILSLLSGAVIAAMLVVSWRGWYDCAMIWTFDHKRSYSLAGVSSHGNIWVRLDFRREGWPASARQELKVAHANGRTEPLVGDPRIGLFGRWPFVWEDLRVRALVETDKGLFFTADFPHWLALALFCPWFPLLWARKRMKVRRGKRRSAAGHCPACDFDLRGTPVTADGSKRCGECGTVVPAGQEPTVTVESTKRGAGSKKAVGTEPAKSPTA